MTGPRVLVRGGDVRRDHAGQVRDRLERREVAQAAPGGEHGLGGPVAQVLERDRAGREHVQHLAQPVDGPGGHDDLVGVALQPARAGELVGERGPELGQAARSS